MAKVEPRLLDTIDEFKDAVREVVERADDRDRQHLLGVFKPIIDAAEEMQEHLDELQTLQVSKLVIHAFRGAEVRITFTDDGQPVIGIKMRPLLSRLLNYPELDEACVWFDDFIGWPWSDVLTSPSSH